MSELGMGHFISQHAQKSCQQRGVYSTRCSTLLEGWDREVPVGGGRVAIGITRREAARLRKEDGYDPQADIRDEDIISPALIRKRLGLSQRGFAEAIHVPVATLQNWEQGRTPMGPSARALMTILAREPEAALRALKPSRAA
jgi:putative transcriptional regulator